jgi:hypothetical protein
MDCRCSFKAFGVSLLHFKVDKMNWGSFSLKKKKKFFSFSNGEHQLWKTPEIAGKLCIGTEQNAIRPFTSRIHEEFRGHIVLCLLVGKG